MKWLWKLMSKDFPGTKQFLCRCYENKRNWVSVLKNWNDLFSEKILKFEEGFYIGLQLQEILEFKMSLIWTKNLNSYLDNINSSLPFTFNFDELALALLICTRSFTFIWRLIMRVGVYVQNIMKPSRDPRFRFLNMNVNLAINQFDAVNLLNLIKCYNVLH